MIILHGSKVESVLPRVGVNGNFKKKYKDKNPEIIHNIVLLTNTTYFFITNTTVLQLKFTLQNRLGFPKCWCTCITTLSRMLRTATLYRISRYDNSLSVFILDFIREAYVVFTSLPFTNSYWPEYDTNIYLRDSKLSLCDRTLEHMYS